MGEGQAREAEVKDTQRQAGGSFPGSLLPASSSPSPLTSFN